MMNFLGHLDDGIGWNWLALLLIATYWCCIYFFARTPKLLNTIPGFCTGIGVLLTFLVLYYNLQNFNPPDIGGNSFLISLVKDLTSAFSTSIIGIFLSLISNPVVKNLVRKIELKELGANNLKHPQILMQEMVDGINRNNTISSKGNEKVKALADVIDGLINNIEEGMTGLFDRLEDTLHTSIDNLSSNAVEDAVKNSQSINEHFLKNATEMLEKNGRELTTATATNQENLKNIFEEMKGFAQSINEQMKSTQDTSADTVNFIEQGFENSVNTMTQNFDTQSSNLATSLGAINTTIEIFNKEMQEATKKVMEDNISLLQKSFEKVELINETSQNNLRQTTKKFADSINEYEKIQGENELIAKMIEKQIKKNKKTRKNQKALLKRWSQLSEDVESIQYRVADIANTIEQLNQIKGSMELIKPNGN